jgi:hypothetical protein
MDSTGMYSPLLIKARPWGELQVYFDEQLDGQNSGAMAMLIKHIISSGLNKRVFGISSLDRIVISIYDPIQFDRESLHIAFDTVTQTWCFKYFSMPFKEAEWTRTYPKELGILKFDALIGLLRW